MNGIQGVQDPEPQIPDKLRITIENAQNRYTVIESEILRLTKLKKADELAVGAFHVEKKRLQDINDGLSVNIAKLTREEEDARARGEAAICACMKVSVELDAIQKELEKKQSEVDNANKELATARADLVSVKTATANQENANKELARKAESFLDTLNSMHKNL